jgi:hypothetical protein
LGGVAKKSLGHNLEEIDICDGTWKLVPYLPEVEILFLIPLCLNHYINKTADAHMQLSTPNEDKHQTLQI